MKHPQLINADCRDYLKDCADNQFDLAIVDPPYGIGEDGAANDSREVTGFHPAQMNDFRHASALSCTNSEGVILTVSFAISGSWPNKSPVDSIRRRTRVNRFT